MAVDETWALLLSDRALSFLLRKLRSLLFKIEDPHPDARLGSHGIRLRFFVGTEPFVHRLNELGRTLTRQPSKLRHSFSPKGFGIGDTLNERIALRRLRVVRQSSQERGHYVPKTDDHVFRQVTWNEVALQGLKLTILQLFDRPCGEQFRANRTSRHIATN